MISPGKHFDKVVLLALIAVQAFLCYNFYSREIAWYPPGNFDQSRYLASAYQIQKDTHDKGVFELVRAIGSRFHFTGLALPIEGALSGLVVGGARLPQLLILFLGFCVLQLVGFSTAHLVWGSRAYGYTMLGLILCQSTPWYWSGGLFDFRLDFVAYCLYGIWVCAAIQSKLFLDRWWAIGCGLIGAVLVLNRFVTVVYLLGVSAAFAGFCIAIQIFWRTNSDFTERMRRRLYNLAISVGILAVVVAPFLIRSSAGWFQYYAVEHGVTKVKDVYALQLGVTNLFDNLLFYPKTLLRDHCGLTFVLGSAIAIVTGLIARFLDRPRIPVPKGASQQDETFLLQIIFLLGTILGPIVVLTADVAKNPCVGSIVGVPAALLVVCLAAKVSPRLGELASGSIRKLAFASSLVIFALGFANEFIHLSRHLPEYAQRQDLTRLVELDKWLVKYAGDHRWTNPAISFDVLSPWLDAFSITDTGFERSDELVEFHPLLSDGVLGVERSEALSLLANSDFAILTNSPKLGVTRTGLSVDASSDAIREFPKILLRFPFSQKIAEYWDDLKAYADKNMTLVKTVQFENFTATVYARSAATPSDH